MDHTRRWVLGGLGAAGGALLLPRLWRPRDARAVAQVVTATSSRDGAGVLLKRALGGRGLSLLDPFLLLDEIHSSNPDDYVAGFPKHPHRGFETVTIMLEGAMEHRDSVGNRGRLGPGSVQWMTAGRGIVHSEMPQQDGGELWGFQLWVNLPARLKMSAPRYQDLGQVSVPEVDLGDARARVLAGALKGQVGPVEGIVVAPTVLDVQIPAGGRFVTEEIPEGHNVFAYVMQGGAFFGPEEKAVPAGNLAVLGPGRTVLAAGESRFLLVAGAPIGEPVARGGPFVMNTQAEIEQAWSDYRSGRLLEG